jgi:geranylgeranyl pyrophosphate synthase
VVAGAASSYAVWSVRVFEQRIRPEIDALRAEIAPGIDSVAWLKTCEPGPTPATHSRLFPGSLFLLWVEALRGRRNVHGAEPVAAAIELMHNASLVHDDVLDGHRMRKGQPTLNATHGRAVALLGGDALAGAAMLALSGVRENRLAGTLQRLGRAAECVAAGQILDEPERWRLVPEAARWEYWLCMCRSKLALGNVGGPLAAFWADREALESAISELLCDYSVVSQIINDFGDLLGFAGYHVKTASLRAPREETSRKPTLPAIWFGTDSPGTGDLTPLVERANREISRRKDLALERVERLPVTGEAKDVLLDFFLSPTLEFGDPES